MKLTFATLVAFLSAYTAAAPLSVEEAASKVLSEFEKYGSEAKDAAEPFVNEVKEFAKPLTDEVEKYGDEFKDAAEPFVNEAEEFAKPVTDEIEEAADQFSEEVESGLGNAPEELKALENFKRDFIGNGQKAGVLGVNAANNDLNGLVRAGGNGKRDFIANDQQAGVLGLDLLNNDLNGLIRVGGNNYHKRDSLDPADNAKKAEDFFEQAAKEVS